jgi:alpha-beta hydrolase superfamily lysophospholipase
LRVSSALSRSCALARAHSIGEHSLVHNVTVSPIFIVPVTPVERQVTLRDGFRLALRVWTPSETPRGTVVIAHGLGEHAGRYQQLARDLGNAGWEVHAADCRGHGRSGGARGVVPASETMRDDLLESLAFARATSARPTILLGHSMGGAFAAWALAHQPGAADALVLSSPALRADLSPVQRVLMASVGRMAPDFVVGNGLNPRYLSHNSAVVAAYRDDPLVHDRVTPRLAKAIMAAGDAARAAAPYWSTPTLLLYAGDDHIVSPAGSAEFATLAPTSVVSTRRFDALYHEIFNETERVGPVTELIAWLRTVAPS